MKTLSVTCALLAVIAVAMPAPLSAQAEYLRMNGIVPTTTARR